MDTQVTQKQREIAIQSTYTDFPARHFLRIVIHTVLLCFFIWAMYASAEQFLKAIAGLSGPGIIDLFFFVGMGLFVLFANLFYVTMELLFLWAIYLQTKNMVLHQPSLKLDEQGILINGHIAIPNLSLAWHEIAMLEVNESRSTKEISFSLFPKNIHHFLSRFSLRQRIVWYGLTVGALSITITLQSPGIEVETYIGEMFGDKLSAYQINVRKK